MPPFCIIKQGEGRKLFPVLPGAERMLFAPPS
jgi:hypothetical protein